jgi:hypothetical protein
MSNVKRALKDGGVVLMTVPGITPSRADGRDGWYWSPTEDALRRLLCQCFDSANGQRRKLRQFVRCDCLPSRSCRRGGAEKEARAVGPGLSRHHSRNSGRVGVLKRLLSRRRKRCRHVPLLDFSRWEYSRSGEGFFVSKCRHCEAEMTKTPRATWKLGRPD